jgi:hypothetical protein
MKPRLRPLDGHRSREIGRKTLSRRVKIEYALTVIYTVTIAEGLFNLLWLEVKQMNPVSNPIQRLYKSRRYELVKYIHTYVYTYIQNLILPIMQFL